MHAQIHRYVDKVALYVKGGKQTAYLEPSEAREIAECLLEAADDIEEQPRYSESDFGTHVIEINPR